MAPRLPLVLEDVRLLLLRLAHQESLSADCGGGAARSNIQLVPYQLQVCYCRVCLELSLNANDDAVVLLLFFLLQTHQP